jgi:hypothetical protein
VTVPRTMNWQQKLKHELKAVGLASLFFGSWIAALLVLKALLLAEYDIAFHGWSVALVGALILSKVVLILEHVPLAAWVRARPAWVDLMLRTLMYSVGTFGVLLLEKGFEGRHEHGGFGGSLRSVFQHAEIHHVWVNAICLSGALFAYNALSVIRRNLGAGGLRRLFAMPLPEEPGVKKLESPLGKLQAKPPIP